MLRMMVLPVIFLALGAAAVFGLYCLIKAAVRNGVREALEERDLRQAAETAKESSRSRYPQ